MVDNLFSGAGAVAAQAVFILIDGRRKDRHAIRGADAGYVLLRDADQRRRREDADLLRTMCVVAIDAGGVTIVVQQRGFGCIVRIGRRREGMANLGRCVFRKDVGPGAIGDTLAPLWQAMQSCSFDAAQ